MCNVTLSAEGQIQVHVRVSAKPAHPDHGARVDFPGLPINGGPCQPYLAVAASSHGVVVAKSITERGSNAADQNCVESKWSHIQRAVEQCVWATQLAL